MRLYSYVVARDFGFAPNPFFGRCTLATCKPLIRKHARPHDWVVGTGSARRGRQGRLVYAMEVAEVVDFDTYWSDPRFAEKRPNLCGSMKQAFGDNIYHRDPESEEWVQEDSHHSLLDGSPNSSNIENDTKSNSVLVAENFVYFGGSGPEIPADLRSGFGVDICAQRGHKNNFPNGLVLRFVEWFDSIGELGYVAQPLDWN